MLTLEQVRAVIAGKLRKGHKDEIRAFLQKHGATNLSKIDPSHYTVLLSEAEVLENG